MVIFLCPIYMQYKKCTFDIVNSQVQIFNLLYYSKLTCYQTMTNKSIFKLLSIILFFTFFFSKKSKYF